ncbi:MAG: polysaccharide deacetylase family protein [Calditrichia bacterium]|nr:polysaccharide deacetylase family protein [Calditrichia bacterium]
MKKMLNKSKYILDLFKMIYKSDIEFDINYGIDNKSKIQIKKGNTKFFKEKSMPSLADVKWKEWQGERIPFFFDSQNNEIITFKQDTATINFDIIASAFFLLSGWQEYAIENRDQFGRFRFDDSIQKQLNLTNKPVVNYYFDILKHTIDKIYGTSLKINLWENKDFVVFVSHDIDDCESAWKEASYWQLKNGNFIAPFKLVFKKIFQNDAWFNFDKILEIEKNQTINSTFNFITDSKPSGGLKNGDYNIADKKFSAVFSNIQKSGSEIAMHGSSRSYNNESKLKNEIASFPIDVIGNRFHYLNYDIENTPEILENSGLAYDSTVGFAESAGFRSSFCLPYFLYDLKNDKPTSIVELPLIFMDSSLRVKGYMNLPKDKIIDLAQELIKEIKKHNGMFSINWHNNRLSDVKDPGWKDIFIEIINICKKENAMFLTGKKITNIFN